MFLNEEQLREYGRRLGAGLGPNAVVALTGELGSGKTTLAKAIAIGLGVTETVTSPTFTLINEYTSGRLPFYHFDVYRLEAPLAEPGYEEYFFGGGVTVIEWADRIEGLLPEDAIWIELSYTDDPCSRCLSIKRPAASAGGEKYLRQPCIDCEEKQQRQPDGQEIHQSGLPRRNAPRNDGVSCDCNEYVFAMEERTFSNGDCNLLAIETTGPICSAALLTVDGRVFYRASVEGLKHLTSLTPMIEDLLREAGKMPERLGKIAVSSGPGSFTGIRIGVATARALAQTLNIPVIKVPTLETFVYLSQISGKPVYSVACPIFDARRNQMYAGAYMLEADGRIMMLVCGGAYDPDEYFTVLSASLAALKKLAERADGPDARIVCRLMGDGLPMFKKQAEAFRDHAAELGVIIEDGVQGDVGLSKSPNRSGISIQSGGMQTGIQTGIQDARAVLAWALRHGIPIGYEELEPIYMRKAEAQRRLDEKTAAESDKKVSLFNMRQAVENDVYAISVIERLSFGEPWLEKSIMDDLRLEYSDYMVCEREGYVLGYAGMHYILDEGHITNVAVHPSVRNQGAGSIVLEKLMRRAEAKGIKAFTLEVRNNDIEAIRFYKKQGFVSEGIRKDYYPDGSGGREDALIMWRRTAAGAE